MRNLKQCILSVAFGIVMIVATEQSGFADYSKLDQSANGLSSIVNTMFGLTGANTLGSNADLVSRYGTTAANGTFKLNETQVFLGSWNTNASMLGLDGNGSNFNSLGTGFHWLSAGYATTPPLAISNANFASRLLYTGTVDGQFGLSIRSFDQLHSSLTDFGSGSGSTIVSGNFPSADYYVYFDVTSLVASYYPGYRAYLVGVQDSQMAASGVYGYNSATFLVLERWDGGGPGPGGGVPEPATMFLWTLGGLSLAGASWRRNRNKKKLLA